MIKIIQIFATFLTFFEPLEYMPMEFDYIKNFSEYHDKLTLRSTKSYKIIEIDVYFNGKLIRRFTRWYNHEITVYLKAGSYGTITVKGKILNTNGKSWYKYWRYLVV